MRVQGLQSRKRDPSLMEFSEPRPSQSTALAAPADGMVPAADDFAAKGSNGLAMAGNGGNRTPQPL